LRPVEQVGLDEANVLPIVGGPLVDPHHLPALAGETLHHRPAETAGGSRDQRGSCHVSLIFAHATSRTWFRPECRPLRLHRFPACWFATSRTGSRSTRRSWCAAPRRAPSATAASTCA